MLRRYKDEPDQILDDAIAYLASDVDENGNVSINEEALELLKKNAKMQRNYILKLKMLNCQRGLGLIQDYKKWEGKIKQGSESFGNYVLYCENRKREFEHQKRILEMNKRWVEKGM